MKYESVLCLQCGKRYSAEKHDVEKGKRKFCSPACNAVYQNKRKIYAEGQSKSRQCERARRAYMKYHGKIECEACGSTSADVHHRDKDRTNISRENLVALCRSDHTTHHNLNRSGCQRSAKAL